MSDAQNFPPPPVPPPLPGPGNGRVPPAWEQPGAALQRFVETARRVLTEPASFYKAMSRQGGLGPPLVFAVVGIVVGSLGSFLTQLMMPFGGFGMAHDAGGFAAALVLVPIISVIGLFIGSGILHVLLMLVAGSKQTYETSFRVLAYTVGSTSPLNIVPFVGGIIGGVWALVVLILGSAEAHEVPQGRAAVAVLLPAVVCCGLGVLFGGALLALIFGAAAAGLAS
jgi:hypothetical protein